MNRVEVLQHEMSTPTPPRQFHATGTFPTLTILLPEFRLQLNNLLQSNGGAGRLRWGDPIRGGPDHRPSWTISAFR